MCASSQEDRPKPEVNTIQAVFFDYGGTLDSPGIAWRQRFYPLYVNAGIKVSPERFAQAFYAADDSLVAENPAHMNLSQIVREQVKRVLEHLHAFDKSIHKKITSQFLSDTFDYIEQISPVLQRIKDSFKTGIISNNYGNLDNICKETGLDTFMDVLVDSNMIGCMKPKGKIFRAGISALGSEPASSVMVGDSLTRDVMGAQAAGMVAIWLSPVHEADGLGKGQKDITVISTLYELPSRVGI